MTKEELFDSLDYEEGDKVYIFRLRERPEGHKHQRITHGFDIFTLLGMTDVIRTELHKTLEGVIKPNIIETEIKVLKDK